MNIDVDRNFISYKAIDSYIDSAVCSACNTKKLFVGLRSYEN